MILIIFNFSCAPICLVIFSISKANVLQGFIEIMKIWANGGKNRILSFTSVDTVLK
jgi:hypothetical protein